MAGPIVTLHQLLEAGAHFGHQTRRWNPRMKPYIFGERNGIHILDLSQTVPLFARALDFVAATVQSGGKVLFVGTKRQAQGPIADAARASGQHFVNHRWLGGMLTNWKTVSNSIKRLMALEEQLLGDTTGFTKQEILQITRERDKLEASLGGIRGMGGIPDVMFVIDANREELAIKEANVLGVPVVAIVDSNVDPSGIAFPIPGNDDSMRAIRLYCVAIAQAAARGSQGVVATDDSYLDDITEPTVILDPKIQSLFESLMSRLGRLSKEEKSKISLEKLAHLARLDVSDDTLFALVTALTNSANSALEQYFVFEDSVTGEQQEITKKAIFQNLKMNCDLAEPSILIDGKYSLEQIYLYFRTKEKDDGKLTVTNEESDFSRATAAARV